MVVLYHVTFYLRHRGFFIPRVPENAIEWDECGETNRICLATSIENCLTAMPIGAFNLQDELDRNHSELKVFTIDTDKYGIKDKDILTHLQLNERRLVIDAMGTEEHWLLNKIKIQAHDMSYIKILNFSIHTREYETYAGLIQVDKVEDLNYEVIF